MVQLQVESSELNGMHMHLWETDKFKTITLLLMAKAPLDEETLTAKALIPHILQGGTTTYKNRKQLKQKLDDMYGATFSTDVQKKGEQQVMTFRIDIAADRFLSTATPLIKEAINLLHHILYEPKVENDGFQTTVVEQEKRSLKQRIDSIYDDKMRYANVRITEEMFNGEAYGLPAYGRVDDLNNLDEKKIYDVYKNMLANDRFDLFVIGAFDKEEVTNTVKQLFTETRAQQAPTPAAVKSKAVQAVKTVHDKQKVKQGKLHMGFRTHTTFSDEAYEAAQVGNAIFGGFPSSKLFINVREKESLAYYAASRIESHKGVLMVMSGIEFDKYDRAVEIIKEQAEAMKAGDFTAEDVEQAKGMLINQALEAIDTPRGFAELTYHEVVANYAKSIEERIEGIRAVTKESVVAAVNKWELDTIYFLKGEDEANEAN
ncbi:Zinc protease [Bacillus sp. JCM 19046]|nr:Zinc protease [Bacillus sp. JCM 19046]